MQIMQTTTDHHTYSILTAPLLLSALLLVACGPQKEAAPEPVNREPVVSLDQPKPFDASKIKFESPGEMLKTSFGKWALAGEPRYFGKDNLYELIDGGAPLFLSYGFVRLVTVDYKSPAKPTQTVSVEVYDMGSPLGAWGRISRYLDNLATPENAGAGLPAPISANAIFGKGDILAWKARYLLHLMLVDEDPTATPETITHAGKQILPGILEGLAEGISGDWSLPKEVPPFATENARPRTKVRWPQHTAGLNALGSGYSCRYQGPDNTAWTVFITDPSDTADHAKEALEKLTGPALLTKQQLDRRIVGVLVDSEAKPDGALVEQSVNRLIHSLESK